MPEETNGKGKGGAERLSEHFSLWEMLRSETAERQPLLSNQQMNPPPFVTYSLRRLCSLLLEPIREGIGCEVRVSSGYRCPEVNRLVGGARTSQHLLGQAADLHLVASPGWCELNRGALQVRDEVSADFILFAWVAAHLETLHVDQLIHEWGIGPGQPAWVHVSIAPPTRAPRREILIIDRSGARKLDWQQALQLGR